jgi:hypothetical protein
VREIGLGQRRGGGYREEGCGDRHQNAVISSTVFRTVSHHFTPWADPSRHGGSMKGLWMVFVRSSVSSFRRPYRSGPSSKRLVSRLNLLQIRHRTPARNESYADDTCAPIMQPAPCGATHDKLTQRIRFVTECALLPRARSFVCHRQATVQNVPAGSRSGLFSTGYSAVPTRDSVLERTRFLHANRDPLRLKTL